MHVFLWCLSFLIPHLFLPSTKQHNSTLYWHLFCMDNSKHWAALVLAICHSTYWESGTQPCLHSHTIPPVSHRSCGPPELRNTTEGHKWQKEPSLNYCYLGRNGTSTIFQSCSRHSCHAQVRAEKHQTQKARLSAASFELHPQKKAQGQSQTCDLENVIII